MSSNVVVRLLLDADGIIKLHLAGVLDRVVDCFRCVIPEPVYAEVVTQGKRRLHRDAEAIEGVVRDRARVVPIQRTQRREAGLGAGELGVLSLLPAEEETIVVSDDRRFLAVLSAEEVPFLTPAGMVVVLARRGILTPAEAIGALDRLRPAIRAAAYWEARQDLEPEGGAR